MVMENRGVLEVLSQKSFTPPHSLSLSMKLDDSNYLVWRKKIMRYIMVYRLEGFIKGSFPALSNMFLDSIRTTPNPKFDTWM